MALGSFAIPSLNFSLAFRARRPDPCAKSGPDLWEASRFLLVNFTPRLSRSKSLTALAKTVIEMTKYFHMSDFCRGEFL